MRVEPLPPWAKAIAAVFLAVFAVVVVIAVRDVLRRDDPLPTRVVRGTVESPSRVVLLVASCNKSPTAEVREEADAVTVTAYAARSGSNGSDCVDAVTVQLHAPLGDRRMLDGSTGLPIRVQG